MKKTFLKAEWRKLIMANYSIDSQVLARYLPAQTELDFWNGTCYVSLVGFMFLNTRLKGIRIPFHTNFEEVNLRFYVKHLAQGSCTRGVVFIKEIVPRPAITFVANTLYGEHYATMPMRHHWKSSASVLEVEYGWKAKHWQSLGVIARPVPQPIAAGSLEEFISEHYWGYTRLDDRRTSAYQVVHPKWEVYPVQEYTISVDFGAVYGPEFSFLNSQKPVSVFLAEGSEVSIKEGTNLQVKNRWFSG
ncbi:YqjF family protein [Sabulibacter ruber]|uniref:YqjF family protein n=1 Tax=Sabulibacter ruber TaxID=2811901 RepID=UPI001A9613AC|nr:DUF2071 domain-containing protein [Sabulibacter ruber]